MDENKEKKKRKAVEKIAKMEHVDRVMSMVPAGVAAKGAKMGVNFIKDPIRRSKAETTTNTVNIKKGAQEASDQSKSQLRQKLKKMLPDKLKEFLDKYPNARKVLE